MEKYFGCHSSWSKFGIGNAVGRLFSRLQLRGLLNYLCPVISNLKMECVLGIACNDFVILASDMTNAHSIIVNKQGI